MGSFSWLKADKLTSTANITIGSSFKFLIPKEFGGGFIQDKYQDYGYLGHKEGGSPKYDMYELLAFWNAEHNNVKEELCWNGDFPKMKEIDSHTKDNRSIGIDIGCYDDEIIKLKYPLKLVSVSYKGDYESLDSCSFGDPEQGFCPIKRQHSKEI